MPIITVTPNEAVYGHWKRIIFIDEKPYVISRELPLKVDTLIYRNQSKTLEVEVHVKIDWEHHPLSVKVPFWKKKIWFKFRDKSFTLKVLQPALNKVFRINNIYVIFDRKWINW